MNFDVQASLIFVQMENLPLRSQSRILTLLVFQFLLTDTCRGQAPVLKVGALGADISLPCHVDPTVYEPDFTLEWTRPDLNPRFVLVWRSGQELVDKKHQSFVGRTSLFPDELKHGNISLKLSKVKVSDQGTYRCFIPALETKSVIQLVVASVNISLPVISLSGVDKDQSGVILTCESAGWYPEPELLWLDAEGHLLSAGPTETLRGPDDLYTVSSRVTVEKRHSNNITCRVQQKNINQSRETHIHVPDDFFGLTCSSAVPIIVCLAVCTVLASACGVFMFKWGRHTIKTRSNEWDYMEKGEKHIYSKKDVNQEGQEHEKLMTGESEPLDPSVGGEKTSNHLFSEKEEEAVEDMMDEEETIRSEQKQPFLNPFKTLNNNQQRREDAVREVPLLKQEPENHKQADEKWSEKLKETQKQLDNKTEENDQLKRHADRLMTSIKEMQQLQTELEAKGKQLESYQQAAEDKQKEANEKLNKAHCEVEKQRAEISELKKELNKQLYREQQSQGKTDSELEEVLKKNEELMKALKEERSKREEAGKEVETLKTELKTKLKVRR
ncbi:butyrophilin subfamily 2 member A2-like isoform X2 [Archocentrus centrarchus]|uniref:butyrophilin subfamily 2 member A2-like isoform X2 n=1 Tax=Archocentrus centrarchus TaxID=63155 RepID=UPI0011E9CA68|nr:butyrophilin subfamily 2 member A2-like isoform X2 [Archocentrus centrarchus]